MATSNLSQTDIAEGWRGGVRICNICTQPITRHHPNCTEDAWADYMELTARLRAKYRIGLTIGPDDGARQPSMPMIERYVDWMNGFEDRAPEFEETTPDERPPLKACGCPCEDCGAGLHCGRFNEGCDAGGRVHHDVAG